MLYLKDIINEKERKMKKNSKRLGKETRILDISLRIASGEVLNTQQASILYGVSERTIRRDIDTIRTYYAEKMLMDGVNKEIVYDSEQKGYVLCEKDENLLTDGEVLAVSKILLESRAFRKEDMTSILNKLITGCVPKSNQKYVKELICGEEFHYVEPRHGVKFIDRMWDMGQAIRQSRYIEIDYYRTKDKQIVKRKIKPVAIMFSEFYFYLTAFIEDEEIRKGFEVMDDLFPTIYRIDRIKEFKVLEERFHIPYKDRFEEGEFRKRIQFMYGGKLQKIKFEYSGPDVDAILDRLPTAMIIDEENGVYTISAEVFGKGIDMWLKSQGENVKIIN